MKINKNNQNAVKTLSTDITALDFSFQRTVPCSYITILGNGNTKEAWKKKKKKKNNNKVNF